jgi:hypothetical protein
MQRAKLISTGGKVEKLPINRDEQSYLVMIRTGRERQ